MINYWTDQEENRLLDLWRNDVPVNEIAEVLERSPSAIYNRIYILRILGECGAWYRNVPKNDPSIESYSECS